MCRDAIDRVRPNMMALPMRTRSIASLHMRQDYIGTGYCRVRSSARTMEDQLVQADLHDIALNKLVAGDAHTVHKGTGGGVMILYLVAAIAHFADGGVQAAHRQVFEENVAIAAASDGHFAQQLKAAYHASHIREV